MLTAGAVVLALSGVVPGIEKPDDDVGGIDRSGMVNGAVFGGELGEKANRTHTA
jgi:hypothetical protein